MTRFLIASACLLLAPHAFAAKVEPGKCYRIADEGCFVQSGESDLSSNYERKRVKHAGAIVKILSASSLQELNSKAESQSFQTPAEFLAHTKYLQKRPPLQGAAFCAQFMQGKRRSHRIFLHESWIVDTEVVEPAPPNNQPKDTVYGRIKPNKFYRIADEGKFTQKKTCAGEFRYEKRPIKHARAIVRVLGTFQEVYEIPKGPYGTLGGPWTYKGTFDNPACEKYILQRPPVGGKVFYAKFIQCRKGEPSILLHESWIGGEVTEEEAASKRGTVPMFIP